MSASPNTHSVKLLFFAKSRELAGTAETRLLLNPDERIRCADLLLDICQRHGLLAIKDFVILAINGEYSSLDDFVDCSTVTEVAVIPPISGG